MTTNTQIGISVLLLLLLLGFGLLAATPAIHKWEREAGYPMGRMCDPNIFNLYVSTCR